MQWWILRAEHEYVPVQRGGHSHQSNAVGNPHRGQDGREVRGRFHDVRVHEEMASTGRRGRGIDRVQVQQRHFGVDCQN